jgi:adenylate cyclase
MYLGEHRIALDHARRAERLSPRDPNMLQVKAVMAFAQFFDGQYSEAGRQAERMSDEFPIFVPALRIMAVSYALAGDLKSAERAARKALELDPSQRVAKLASQMPLRRVEDRKKWEDGLLRAGFPP